MTIPQTNFRAWSAPEGWGNAWTRDSDHAITVLPLAFCGNAASLPLRVDDGASLNAAFTELRAFGLTSGRIRLGPGAYTLLTQPVIPAGFILDGAGQDSILNCYANGIFSHGDQPGNATIQGPSTQIRNLVVDGSNIPSSATVNGIDVGDQYGILIENCWIQNFTSTGQGNSVSKNPVGPVGLNICNTATLTEKCIVRNTVINSCGTVNATSSPSQGGGAAVQMTTTGGASTTSKMYSDFDVWVNQPAHYNGLVIARQGHMENGWFRMRGNFQTDGTTSNAAAIVIGVANSGGGAPQQGHIFNEQIYVKVETDPGGSGADMPYTIYGGTNADNQMYGCQGGLQFLDGWNASNLTAGNFGWSGGRIKGDVSLATLILNTPSPPVSGTTYINGGTAGSPIGMPMLFTVAGSAGGSVTGLTINGDTPASLTGSFYIPHGATYSVTYTGTLEYSFIPMIEQ